MTVLLPPAEGTITGKQGTYYEVTDADGNTRWHRIFDWIEL